MTETFADKIIAFNQNLKFEGKLPKGFSVLNPFLENPETMQVMRQFYKKFYNDTNERKFILGINPSRHGAAVTGIPFTDTKQLKKNCGIKMKSAKTHEVSSVFFYDMINEFGGVKEFYSQFYINSPFPLAIVQNKGPDRWVNANYYDNKVLFNSLKNYMIKTLKKYIDLGIDTSEVFVLGKKSADYIEILNDEIQLFEKITALEHPRYIQQYKFKNRQFYIDKYLLTLNQSEV